MRTCIICNKSKSEDEFNIEHVIPEALGNKKLVIDLVCTKLSSRFVYFENVLVKETNLFVINPSSGKVALI